MIINNLVDLKCFLKGWRGRRRRGVVKGID
jgi:hypothetical protein